jgi:hypothetical protein
VKDGRVRSDDRRVPKAVDVSALGEAHP